MVIVFISKNLITYLIFESLNSVPETVRLCLPRLWNLFCINKVPSTPIALNKPPCTCYIDGVPRVSESVVLKLDPRLIARRFTVTLDHHTVEPGITMGTCYSIITETVRNWEIKLIPGIPHYFLHTCTIS